MSSHTECIILNELLHSKFIFEIVFIFVFLLYFYKGQNMPNIIVVCECFFNHFFENYKLIYTFRYTVY